MPSLGADMEAGTLAEWLVKPGDTVKRGDIVAVVETQKGAIEIEIFEAGTIAELVVQPGEEVPVGAVLAILRREGEAAAPPAEPEKAKPEKARPKPAAMPPAPAAPAPRRQAPGGAARPHVSPAARRRARELGLDPAALTGSGEGGAVTLADVEKAARPAEKPAAAARPAEPGEAMRQAIAAAMARSKREIPHYYLATTVDMTAALDWLAAENERRPVEQRLLYGVLLVRAVAKALKDFPEMNGFWRDGGFSPSERIHVGAAIALRRGGLVAPAIHDTDRLDLTATMAAFRDLVQRARAGRLRGSEVADPTITLTSLGENGVETIFPVIYPPQVAILGFGSVVERPWAAGGRVEVRRVMQASLAGDHRVGDGRRGADFLARIAALLQEPETL